jgi:hypothetical protein
MTSLAMNRDAAAKPKDLNGSAAQCRSLSEPV